MKQKIWIFIIEKKLDELSLNHLYEDCQMFVKEWTSHDMPLDASVELYKNRLLIFRNNEALNPIGGCATDKLFHFIQACEKKYQTNLLNRKLVVFEKNNELVVEPSDKIVSLIQNNVLTENTIVYNTAILHSDEWGEFKKPLKDSWLKMVCQMA